MRETYNPQEIESQVQEQWRQNDVYRAVEHALGPDGKEKPKFYVCSMLPYPSASCIWVMSATTPSTMCTIAIAV